MEMILYIILGAFIGWNFPHPGYAKWIQNKVINFCEKIINKGKQKNILFNENLGPAEDVYIGYVLNKNITLNDKIKIFSSYLAFNDLNNEFTQKLKNTIEQYKQKQNFEMEHCIT